jgi:hypothetical protein
MGADDTVGSRECVVFLLLAELFPRNPRPASRAPRPAPFPQLSSHATLRHDDFIALSRELALDRFPSGPVAHVLRSALICRGRSISSDPSRLWRRRNRCRATSHLL